MQANMPGGKKWHNAYFVRALRKAVEDGDLVESNKSYKLSDGLRRNLKKEVAESYKTKPEPEAYMGLSAGAKEADGDMARRLEPPKQTPPKKKAAPNKKAAPKKKAVR